MEGADAILVDPVHGKRNSKAWVGDPVISCAPIPVARDKSFSGQRLCRLQKDILSRSLLLLLLWGVAQQTVRGVKKQQRGKERHLNN